MEIREFIEQRLAEDEQWALAASAPASWRGEHAPIPTGVRWTWAVGENWEPYKVDPLEEYVGDSAKDYSPTLVTVDEWPYAEPLGRHTHFQHRVIGNAEEVRSVDGGHIVRHDPARVLREVAAKRAIIADLDRARAQQKQHPKDLATTGWMLGMMRALDFLALAWEDHPDFDPAWRING